jgi:hypothetical protein
VRDDFSKRTIDTLAKRVGYRCSNPGCRTQTVGLAQSHVEAVIVGVAARITAAAADHHVGRLLDGLKKLNILDDTLVYYIIATKSYMKPMVYAAPPVPSSQSNEFFRLGS